MSATPTLCRPGRNRRTSRLVPALLAALLTLGLAAAPEVRAQSHRLRFDQLGPEEGLSQVSILAVLQDRRGFMWFGTQDGLNRHDGYAMRIFRHDPDDDATLSGSWITGLYEDQDGFIWVANAQPGVLDRLDPRSERVTRFVHDPDDPASLGAGLVNPVALWDDGAGSLWVGTFGDGIAKLDKTTGGVTFLTPGRFVSTLVTDRRGELWIGTLDAGLVHRLRPGADGEERFEHFRHDPADPDSLSHDRVASVFESRDGALWVGTQGGGLNHYDRRRRRFTRLRHDDADPASLGDDVLAAPNGILPRPIQEDRRGDLWLVTAGGVSRFDRAAGSFVNYRHDPDDPRSLSSEAINTLHVDREGRVWVGTRGAGLNLHQPAHDGFLVSRHRAGDRHGLSSDLVNTVFEGRSGLLWIGTTDGGLSKYSPQSNKFTYHASNPFEPRGLTDDMIWSLVEDRSGRLWVGTLNGGLHRFDDDRETVTARFGRLPGTDRDLGSDHVRWVLEDSRGRIWVGTNGAGLSRLDAAGETVESRYVHRDGDSATLSSDSIYHLFEDSRGILWVGTTYGWNRLDPESGRFTHHLADDTDPSSLAGNSVRVTFEDRDGNLWVGTDQGLSHFHPDTGTFTSYRHDVRDRTSLSSSLINDVHQDDDGFLWLATYGGGLNRMDPETGRCDHVTTRDGLPNDSLYSVLPDGEGSFWISTNQGLARFDPRTGSIERFGVEDGLQGLEFNAGAFFRSPRGEIFFGGINGFNTFFPDALPSNGYVPPVVLTGFQRFGRPDPQVRSLADLERITLSHKDRYVSFEFAALDYVQPAKNRYAYMLEGFDPSWIDAGTRRRADYTNLPGGRYTFRVKGSNGDGVWNEEGTSIRVVVVPPPWQRWWAYGLYGLALLGVVTGYARHKTATHRRELEQERVAAENRRRAEELEKARRLQLSMLPTHPPSHPGLEVCAAMRTAAEVGGDFYDFFPQPDGSLFVVTGDATGHGLSAGMMVAMAKSALKALEVSPPDSALARLDNVIRAVHPGRVQMALSMTHLVDGRAVHSSAGMPPAFLCRGATGAVEEILLPGLPLGSAMPGTYRRREVDIAPGDTLLLLSDGLPELRDPDGRMLGYDAIPRCLAEHATASPEEILQALLDLGDRWCGCTTPNDDVTLVVIRRRADGAAVVEAG